MVESSASFLNEQESDRTKKATERTFWCFSNPLCWIPSPETERASSFFTFTFTALLLKPYRDSENEASEEYVQNERKLGK